MSKPNPTFTLGKSILSIVNLVTLTGPFLADWNNPNPSETHIHNPSWPPHARYHNGQTMSTGLFIGLVTFFILFFTLPATPSPREQELHLGWVLLLQHIFYLGSLSGIFYPGAAWMDPQFGEGRPQLYGFPVLVALCWVGWGAEVRRLGRRGKGKVKGQ
ncbi:hypothetical protein N0V95_003158 [Ascochyta clinopodiicola]|nr:hypothetical protein N0V95_003158 [Ascochyta clinopodiicola]